jgi:hypothetical protein
MFETFSKAMREGEGRGIFLGGTLHSFAISLILSAVLIKYLNSGRDNSTANHHPRTHLSHSKTLLKIWKGRSQAKKKLRSRVYQLSILWWL